MFLASIEGGVGEYTGVDIEVDIEVAAMGTVRTVPAGGELSPLPCGLLLPGCFSEDGDVDSNSKTGQRGSRHVEPCYCRISVLAATVIRLRLFLLCIPCFES